MSHHITVKAPINVPLSKITTGASFGVYVTENSELELLRHMSV